MSRIALIGDNSIEYIEKLITIWNNGDCAVLIDSKIPPATALEMMAEANVRNCYIERKYLDSIGNNNFGSICFVPFETSNNKTRILYPEIYDQYVNNYSSNEAVVIYSSGTTGKSKGIILSHYAISTNADDIISYMQPNETDCIYITRALTHSSTITGELLVALKTRTPVLISPVVVPPRYVLINICKFKVSIVGTNPLLLSMYSIEYQKHTYDISSLKKIYVSGSILDDRTYELVHNIFPSQEIYNVYGLSELGPRVTAQRKDCCKSNSVGRPIGNIQIAIVNEHGQCVITGEKGIIHVKTPCQFSGYISGEIKFKSLYSNWYNTGDIGFWDGDNELHIVGRIDDMIILNTHKIYLSDVAAKIKDIANFSECYLTVINIHRENCLCCLYVAETAIQHEILVKLGSVIPAYEMPKHFVRVESMPKTRTHKVSSKLAKKILESKLGV